MILDCFENELRTERDYWECRAKNLEVIVCELLAKNERLRMQLQMPVTVQPHRAHVFADRSA